MSDFKRYTVSINKKGEWRAYDKKTNQFHENVVSESRDKLAGLLKKETGFNKHYRRRGEWILSNGQEVDLKKSE